MSFKLSWKPQFIKQSQAIIGTETYSESVDPKSLDYKRFRSIDSVRDFLKAMTRPYWAKLGQILAISSMIEVVSIASIVLGTSTLQSNGWISLPVTLAAYLVLRMMRTLMLNWTAFVGNRVAAEMTGNLIMRLGYHIAKLSPLSQKNFSSGNLKTMAISDAQNAGDLMHTIANRGVGFILAPLVAPFVLYHFAGVAGIFGYLSMLLMILFSAILCKKMMSYFDAEMMLEDDCTTITGEWLKHQKTARMMQASDFFAEKITHVKYESFKQARWGMYWATFIFGFSTRWWVIPPVVMIATSHWLDLQIPISDVVASVWYVSIMTGHLVAVPDLIIRGGKAVAALKRLVRLLKEPHVDSFLLPENTSQNYRGGCDLVLFQNVSLQLDGASILEDINVAIDLTKKTAIIGQLGAGKSSFLSLLSGNLFASEGQVLVRDGENIKEIRQHATFENWRKQQVLVTQEAFVESSDIKNNIALERSQSADDRLLQSLYDVAMHQDILNFKSGIDESLGETGINLSGGQKQRLNLARAIYSERKYLIMDDPMSAVDEAVADHLWQSLNSKYQGFIISTHRMKYAQECDHVIVLSQGRVVEQGPPEQLLNRQGSFTKMYELAALGGR